MLSPSASKRPLPQLKLANSIWLTKAGLYSLLFGFVIQIAVFVRYRHIFFFTDEPEGCGYGRYCELAKWNPGDPLPEYVARPHASFETEWPPEHGPESVKTTRGLTHLLNRENDEAVRKEWGGRWRTPVVIVPAVFSELDDKIPGWYVSSLWSKFRSLYLYQRRYPDLPRFAPNYGTESGVYYRFIVDHYENLPDITVFVHSYPEAHNLQWLEWVHALRPNATFASLSDFFVEQRAFDEMMEGENGENPYLFFAEQCLRDIFEDIGSPLPAGERLTANQWCCAQVIASREQIRRHPKAVYERILQRVGTPPGLCHLGAPPRTDTYVSTVTFKSKVYVGPEFDDGFTGYVKQVLGHATEYSISSVLGRTGFNHPQTDWDAYCAQFQHTCALPGSPCKGRRRRPADVCTKEIYDDDELEVEQEVDVTYNAEENAEGEEGGGGAQEEAAEGGEDSAVRRLR